MAFNKWTTGRGGVWFAGSYAGRVAFLLIFASMPVYRHQIIPDEGEWGLWEISEGEDWFLSRMALSSAEQLQLDKIKGHRRLEWMAARMLLHHMSGRNVRGTIVKDDFGKPHISGSPWQISISHSRAFAAAIAAPGSVGIDIQHFVPKIERIVHKFISDRESGALATSTRLPHLHLFWCAKEALYKAYGRRELDFCEHILIEPFRFDPRKREFRGWVRKGGFNRQYRLFWEQVEDYFLVYAIE